MLRTFNCGELTKKHNQKTTQLCGWVQSRRDHGGVIFIDLRDRYGLTQVVFDPSHDRECHKNAEHIGREYVLRVKGRVRLRKPGMKNPRLKTGEIEVLADELEIINNAEVPPFEIDDKKPSNEDLRLEYRYLDLRRPQMVRHLTMRHNAAQAVREYLNSKNFLEIETPLLIRSTPEGARDYIVPSRVNQGRFYALPQSPQLYKQILMVGGMDRYYQIARCLRDEDLRADRQPEFTQIDIEMSFITQEDIYELIEGMMKHVFKKILNLNIKTPFPKINYDEAMSRYGSDKPDIRFGLELVDITDVAGKCDYGIFRDVAAHGGIVKGINAKGCAAFSRKDMDELSQFVSIYGAKGLTWMKVTGNKLESSVVKYFSSDAQARILKLMNAKNNDLLLFVADKHRTAAESLGQLRLKLGNMLKLIPETEFSFCWVIDFPLFEWDESAERFAPMHHIFTMPNEEDMGHLEKNPEKVRGRLYDLTLNGTEIFGGSIRIHKREIQEKVLKVIGMDYKDAERKFGFLLKAFKYGAPVHGGIAGGFDRIVALMCGFNDIREVIAFPKNKNAQNPMDGSPAEVDDEQLKELDIKLGFVKK